MIGASSTPFRIRPPQKLADSRTESMANNAIASGYQAGYARPAMQSKAGFSVDAKDRMQADQKYAASVAEGAASAAGIRAEDQGFNSAQQYANAMLQQQARLFDAGQTLDANQSTADRMFARRAGNQSLAMARQRASLALQQALMSEGYS
jgi:hypothetical protein